QEELGVVHPVAPRRRVPRQVVLQGRLHPLARGSRVAGEHVVEGPEVRRALDVRVTTQGDDTAAGPADVAEEDLEEGEGADLLDAVGRLVELEGVGDGSRLVGS